MALEIPRKRPQKSIFTMSLQQEAEHAHAIHVELRASFLENDARRFPEGWKLPEALAYAD